MERALRNRSVLWVGTAVMLGVISTVVVTRAWAATAAPGDDDTTFVPIDPCRLADTRPAPNRVGDAATFQANETETFTAHGTNGKCTLPVEAVGLSLNVTPVGATADSFLTIWGGGARPLASSLNPSPGQPPVPNAVSTPLADDGSFRIYNLAGSVDVVIDVNGYYTKGSLQQLQNRLAAAEAKIASLERTNAANRLSTLEATTGNLAGRTGALEANQPFAVYAEFTPELDDPGAQCSFNDFNDTPCSLFTGSTETMQEITVTAPAAGHVTVTATATIGAGPSNEGIECQLMEVIGNPNGRNRGFWLSSPANFYEQMTLVRTFAIGAGSSKTYYQRCRNLSGDLGYFAGGMMTAIWTPNP